MSQSGQWIPEAEAEAEEDPNFELEFEAEPGAEIEEEPRDSPQDRSVRLKKSPSAFRTISEVADDLHIPQHVLRFWETRFPQVKPLKRGGGRRYYRPEDISLLRRISDLLYIQGYTIKGVQRLLREGDGTLTGDLPPPDMAERGDDPEPPESHLPAAAERVHQPQGPDREEIGSSAAPDRSPDVEALEQEVLRLRRTLDAVLGGLVELRSRLPL